MALQQSALLPVQCAASPMDDGDAPVLDHGIYVSTVSVLSREQVRTFLHALVVRGEDVLKRLAEGECAGGLRSLSFCAHRLGGSAGSFGFRRLANAAAAFEYAADAASNDTAARREALRRATEASVEKLRELASAA